MKNGVDLLESILGQMLFRKYVHILLTDRGSEFSAAEAMECSPDGTRRTRVYYCDPMQSGQRELWKTNMLNFVISFQKELT